MPQPRRLWRTASADMSARAIQRSTLRCSRRFTQNGRNETRGDGSTPWAMSAASQSGQRPLLASGISSRKSVSATIQAKGSCFIASHTRSRAS